MVENGGLGHERFMRWWLNPFHLRDGVRDLRRILRGGGPRLVRLAGIGNPEGLLVPAVPFLLEIEARDGTKVGLDPRLPLPFVAGWAYRLAHRLRVPLIRDTGRVRFEARVPFRG